MVHRTIARSATLVSMGGDDESHVPSDLHRMGENKFGHNR
jgi:hypothetical protein